MRATSPAQRKIFFSQGECCSRASSKITSHNMTLHHDCSHPIPVLYTCHILADPLSFMSHLYHFHCEQLTQSTTWQSGTPERGATLLRYRRAAVLKRACIAAPQLTAISTNKVLRSHRFVALQLSFHRVARQPMMMRDHQG